MSINHRIARLEGLIKQKTNGNHMPELNLSKKEMEQIYKDASTRSERLYIKTGTKYVDIDNLDSTELQRNYRDLIDGRIKLYGESDLKEMV